LASFSKAINPPPLPSNVPETTIGFWFTGSLSQFEKRLEARAAHAIVNRVLKVFIT
jgi:hypothetical protein